MYDEELHDLFGVMRDGLGALRNLEKLLTSVRVSPKSVAHILPDVAASGPAMQAGIRRFVDRCNASPNVGQGPSELLAFVEPRLQELTDTLDQSAGAFNAAKRLELERLVKRTVEELELALGLMELLELSVAHLPMQLDLVELIGQCREGDQPGGPDVRPVRIPVHLPKGELPVEANPRLAYGVIGIAAASLAGKSDTDLSLILTQHGSECCIELVDGGEHVETNSFMTLNLPQLIPPSMPCADSCIRRLGGTLEVGAKEGHVRLCWPRRTAAAAALR